MSNGLPRNMFVPFPKETHYLLGNVATIFAGVGGILLLTKLLSVSEMGQYAVYISFVFLGVMVGASWVNETYVKMAKEEMLDKKCNDPRQSQSVRLAFYLLGMGLVGVIYGIFHAQIASFVGLSKSAVISMFIISCFQSLLIWQQAYYRVTQNIVRAAYLVAMQRVMFVCLLITMFIFDLGGVYNVIAAMLISNFVIFFVSLSPFKLVFSELTSVNAVVVKKYFNHALPFFIGGVCLYTVNYVDIAVLNIYSNSESVGLYSVMYSAFNAMVLLLMSVNSVFLNRIVEHRKMNNGSWPNWYASIILRILFVYSIIMIVGLFMVEAFILNLLGLGYAEGVTSMKILLVASVFYLITAAAMPIYTAYDFSKYFFYVSAVRALINVIADVVLVPKFGIEGAAAGTLVSFIVAAFVGGYCLHIVKTSSSNSRISTHTG